MEVKKTKTKTKITRGGLRPPRRMEERPLPTDDLSFFNPSAATGSPPREALRADSPAVYPFNSSAATGSPPRRARHAKKTRVCIRCGALGYPDCEYCSRSCYLGEVEVQQRECLTCKKLFKPSKPERLYCSKRCYGLSLLHSPGVCARCGREFLAKDSQKYCSEDCRVKPRELTWADITRPTKPTWREVPRAKWRTSHFWYWLCDSMSLRGYAAERYLSAMSWAILRNFLKSQGMAEVISVVECFVAEYPVYLRQFKWSETGAFRSQQLIGYWDSIVGMQISRHVQHWDGDTSGWGPLVQRDMSTFDSSWGPLVPRDMSNFSTSWDEETTKKVAKPKGRILLADWRNRPEVDWVAPTLWSMVTEKVTLTGAKVRALNRGDRKKLESFMVKESLPVVIAITRELLDDYVGYTLHLTWHGALTASIFIGFWGAFKKAVKKRFPRIEEVARDS